MSYWFNINTSFIVECFVWRWAVEAMASKERTIKFSYYLIAMSLSCIFYMCHDVPLLFIIYVVSDTCIVKYHLFFVKPKGCIFASRENMALMWMHQLALKVKIQQSTCLLWNDIRLTYEFYEALPASATICPRVYIPLGIYHTGTYMCMCVFSNWSCVCSRARKIILWVTSPTMNILLASPFLEEIPISAMLNLG
jgi:hypothetical protein